MLDNDALNAAVVGEQVAAQVDGIDFVRLQPEWLDIVVAKEGRDRQLCRALKGLFASSAFRREYGRIVHGSTENLGAVVYEC